MSRILEEHRQYLADRARVDAFRKAIDDVVKIGDVVVDLGAGTGILGLLACRAGAKRVYSIDEGGMVQLAREICEANGFQDRVIFIRDLSTRIELPERVDVVVADQLGPFGFEAGVRQYFSDARQRFLKPEGVLVPSRVDLCVVPVECAEVFARVEFWSHCAADFDLRPARSIAVNTGHSVKLRPEHLLADPAIGASVDLSHAPAAPLSIVAVVVANRSGMLHGIGGWFVAHLSDHVVMSNSPVADGAIDRRNVFFPVDRPMALAKGDYVGITMQIAPDDATVTWSVEVWRQDDTSDGGERRLRKARFTQSTFQGMLISKEDLQKSRPHFIPRLSPWGEARRCVLELCDGKRTLSDIEETVYRRHPGLFASPSRAAAFVAEVVTRYSL